MKNPIDDIFGIEREEEIEQEKPPIVLQKVEETDDQAIQDFEMARQNIIDTIEESKEVVAEMINVAKLSQHPRAYEVAANMIKNLSDVTEKLMILQKQQHDLKPKEATQTNINVDKAVFVGSTTELLKKLKNESAS